VTIISPKWLKSALDNILDTYQSMVNSFLVIILLLLSSTVSASTCFGSTSNGRLEEACKLPLSGANYSSYSTVLWVAGRTYVHCKVRDVLVNSYKALRHTSSGYVFVYGETGKKNGGVFKPHKTHQNGLSVDLMIPVKNADGESVKLPTHILNKYGYDIDFTLDGIYKNLVIDYEAFAAQLAAIKTEAKSQGIGIWRVLFDPKMQHNLRLTSHWQQISDIPMSTKRSWVRHDDHFHIDFIIPCESM